MVNVLTHPKTSRNNPYSVIGWIYYHFFPANRSKFPWNKKKMVNIYFKNIFISVFIRPSLMRTKSINKSQTKFPTNHRPLFNVFPAQTRVPQKASQTIFSPDKTLLSTLFKVKAPLSRKEPTNQRASTQVIALTYLRTKCAAVKCREEGGPLRAPLLQKTRIPLWGSIIEVRRFGLNAPFSYLVHYWRRHL